MKIYHLSKIVFTQLLIGGEAFAGNKAKARKVPLTIAERPSFEDEKKEKQEKEAIAIKGPGIAVSKREAKKSHPFIHEMEESKEESLTEN